jgi:hypothetical protein
MRGITMLCVSIAVLVCSILTVPPQTSGGALVQQTVFTILPKGSNPGSYNQLSPSLAPLNVVAFDSTCTGTTSGIRLTNTTSAPVSFKLTIQDTFSDDALFFFQTQTIPLTLSANQTLDTGFSINGGKPLIGSASLYNPVGFVGTGTLVPDVSAFETAFTDSGVVHFTGLTPTGDIIPNYNGIETITYLYGPTSPEPASLVMLSIGLAAVAGFAWRQACLARRVSRDVGRRAAAPARFVPVGIDSLTIAGGCPGSGSGSLHEGGRSLVRRNRR